MVSFAEFSKIFKGTERKEKKKSKQKSFELKWKKDKFYRFIWIKVIAKNFN